MHNLEVLFQGDPVLVNLYHALCQPEGATRGQPYASKFADFLASGEARAIVRDYGKDRYGKPTYRDAEYARAYEHGKAEQQVEKWAGRSPGRRQHNLIVA